VVDPGMRGQGECTRDISIFQQGWWSGGGGGRPCANRRYICHREAFIPRQRDFAHLTLRIIRGGATVRIGVWKREIEVSR